MLREDMEYLHKYRVSLPEGRVGGWAIEKYTYTDEDMNTRPMSFPNVEYTRLTKDTLGGPCIVMHDEPQELATTLRFVERAEGDVFITGLGLGAILGMLYENPKVKTITVLENSPEVLELSGKYYLDKYPEEVFKIIFDDAMEYVPDRIYDCIWHDFWTDDFNTITAQEVYKRYEPYGKMQMSWLDELGA